MKHAPARGLSRTGAMQLLGKAKNYLSIDSRMDFFSRQFLGRAYKQSPLIGSSETAEVLTACLDGFDCVTYIETVLALARATKVDEFIEWLRKIRYEDGRIHWGRRNHYMIQWIRNNVHGDTIEPTKMPGVAIVSKERVLNVVPGLKPQRVRIKCLPKAALPRIESHFHTGDLMFFVSTRKHLDVFHAGIIVCNGTHALIRHASRSEGVVVEQKLSEFLKANRMAGVIVVRPLRKA